MTEFRIVADDENRSVLLQFDAAGNREAERTAKDWLTDKRRNAGAHSCRLEERNQGGTWEHRAVLNRTTLATKSIEVEFTIRGPRSSLRGLAQTAAAERRS